MKWKEKISLSRTERFKKCVLELDQITRKKLKKQLNLLVSNPRHPSLRIKKIKRTRSIFEARVNDFYRFTFQYNDKNEILLRVVGPHNSVLDNNTNSGIM